MSQGLPSNAEQIVAPPKRLGSPSEETVQAEHASLVKQVTASRIRQEELDKQSHFVPKQQ